MIYESEICEKFECEKKMSPKLTSSVSEMEDSKNKKENKQEKKRYQMKESMKISTSSVEWSKYDSGLNFFR